MLNGVKNFQFVNLKPEKGSVASHSHPRIIIDLFNKIGAIPMTKNSLGETKAREEALEEREQSENETNSQEEELEYEGDKGEKKEVVKNFVYYFNRFRYYHYCVAEAVDTFIGVVCMTIIKLYFFLVGGGIEDIEEDILDKES